MKMLKKNCNHTQHIIKPDCSKPIGSVETDHMSTQVDSIFFLRRKVKLSDDPNANPNGVRHERCPASVRHITTTQLALVTCDRASVHTHMHDMN